MPRNSNEMKNAIQEKIGSLMERVMERVLTTDPFTCNYLVIPPVTFLTKESIC